MHTIFRRLFAQDHINDVTSISRKIIKLQDKTLPKEKHNILRSPLKENVTKVTSNGSFTNPFQTRANKRKMYQCQQTE